MEEEEFENQAEYLQQHEKELQQQAKESRRQAEEPREQAERPWPKTKSETVPFVTTYFFKRKFTEVGEKPGDVLK